MPALRYLEFTEGYKPRTRAPTSATREETTMQGSSPIIPWLGGKRRLADKLIPLFPPHECYVEVFAGGAALYLLRPMPAQTEVLNDINGELVNAGIGSYG